jgi:hypothetical protein
MLPFRSERCDQIETIGFDRPRFGGNQPAVDASAGRFGQRACFWLVTILLLFGLLTGGNVFADKKKGRGHKGKQLASPGEQSLTNIPLPVGQEAKGLVLPDFDLQGRLRGRFEAGQARRIDEDHVGFHHLKITTYTPDNRPDLVIEMNDSILDLKTRILTSTERTTIRRADFNLAGDSVQFNADTRIGKLMGNVKMVITDQSRLKGTANQ